MINNYKDIFNFDYEEHGREWDKEQFKQLIDYKRLLEKELGDIVEKFGENSPLYVVTNLKLTNLKKDFYIECFICEGELLHFEFGDDILEECEMCDDCYNKEYHND